MFGAFGLAHDVDLDHGLCGFLQSLAVSTWRGIREAYELEMKLGEETITDIITMKIQSSAGVHGLPNLRVKAYNRREEGQHGADWDLWVVEAGHGLGLRFQAKVSDVSRQRFAHLHYLSGKLKTSQAELLTQSAASDGLTPLYLLYQTWTRNHPSPHTTSVGHQPHGCCVLRPSWVVDNVQEDDGADIEEVAPYELPWQLLFCGVEGPDGLPHDLVRRLIVAGLADQDSARVVDQPLEVTRLLNDRLLGEPLPRPLVVIEAVST